MAIFSHVDVMSNFKAENLMIYFANKFAIKKPASVLVQVCRDFLNEISNHSKVMLLSIRRHRNIGGKRFANRTWNFRHIIANISSDCLSHTEYCQFIFYADSVSVARGGYCNRWILQQVDFASDQFIALSQIIISHCPFDRHVDRLGIPFKGFWRSHKCKVKEDTVSHFLCQRIALRRKARRSLTSRNPWPTSST